MSTRDLQLIAREVVGLLGWPGIIRFLRWTTLMRRACRAVARLQRRLSIDGLAFSFGDDHAPWIAVFAPAETVPVKIVHDAAFGTTRSADLLDAFGRRLSGSSCTVFRGEFQWMGPYPARMRLCVFLAWKLPRSAARPDDSDFGAALTLVLARLGKALDRISWRRREIWMNPEDLEHYERWKIQVERCFPDCTFEHWAEFARGLDSELRESRDKSTWSGSRSPWLQDRRNPALEDVQFTLFRPEEVSPGWWSKLLLFTHLAERRPDATAVDPDPVAEVERQARAILGSAFASYVTRVADGRLAIPRESEITVELDLPGCEVRQGCQRFEFLEDVQRSEFLIRAPASAVGVALRGSVRVFRGLLLLAEIVVNMRVRELDSGAAPAMREASARPFRKIFASYSHADGDIVSHVRGLIEGIGDRYMQDCTELRAGELWCARLEELISEADVFQLFWSRDAMRSDWVRREYEYALGLQRQNFVRPTYWQVPLPEDHDAGLPPDSLRRLHFARIPVEVGAVHGDSDSSERTAPLGTTASHETHDPSLLRSTNALRVGLPIVLVCLIATLALLGDRSGDEPVPREVVARLAADVQRIEKLDGLARAPLLPRGLVGLSPQTHESISFLWRGPSAPTQIWVALEELPSGLGSPPLALRESDEYLPPVRYSPRELAERGIDEHHALVVWDLGLGEANPDAVCPIAVVAESSEPPPPLRRCIVDLRTLYAVVVPAPSLAFRWSLHDAGGDLQTSRTRSSATFVLAKGEAALPEGTPITTDVIAKLIADERFDLAKSKLDSLEEERREEPMWLVAITRWQIAIEDGAGARASLDRLLRRSE